MLFFFVFVNPLLAEVVNKDGNEQTAVFDYIVCMSHQ